jgi:hypothetical protein
MIPAAKSPALEAALQRVDQINAAERRRIADLKRKAQAARQAKGMRA